jgi:hypothetical protein
MFRDGKDLRNEKSKVRIRSKTFDNEALFLECSFYGMEGNVLSGFKKTKKATNHQIDN